MRSRAISFWIVGSIAIFFAFLIFSTASPAELGSNAVSILLAYIVAFVLILAGGMFWISIMHLE
jgi:hypothetical protein